VSRIGRLPVDIPAGVQVELNGSKVRVKGAKGEISLVKSRHPVIEKFMKVGEKHPDEGSERDPETECLQAVGASLRGDRVPLV